MKEKRVVRYAKDFEKNPFWVKVMKPAMMDSIQGAKDRMVYCEDVREIRGLQAGIKMTMTWLNFPVQKHDELIDDEEFENAMNETEQSDSDKGQT